MVFMMNVNFLEGVISFGGITAEWWYRWLQRWFLASVSLPF